MLHEELSFSGGGVSPPEDEEGDELNAERDEETELRGGLRGRQGRKDRGGREEEGEVGVRGGGKY